MSETGGGGVTTDPTAAAARLPQRGMVRVGRLARAAALGAATGGRSTAGLAALSWTSTPADPPPVGRTAAMPVRVATGGAALGEVVLDKTPVVPSRTGPLALVPRLLFAALAAVGVGRRDAAPAQGAADEWFPAVEALVAAGAAAGAAFGAVAARGALSRRLGSDLPGAITEDVLVAGLAWAGARRPERTETADQLAR